MFAQVTSTKKDKSAILLNGKSHDPNHVSDDEEEEQELEDYVASMLNVKPTQLTNDGTDEIFTEAGRRK